MYGKMYESMLEEQKQQASGTRLERLMKQGEGEKKLLVEILLPVLKATDGIVLEYEFMTHTDVKVYIDAFYSKLNLGFEWEGFVAHAQSITRTRFDFERNKIRAMALNDYNYFPFTWDEMDQKPEMCRRAIYEILGRYTSSGERSLGGASYSGVSLYEREVIRYALRLGRPIRIMDVSHCLQSGKDFSLKVIRNMLKKQLLKPMNENSERKHYYVLMEGASKYLW